MPMLTLAVQFFLGLLYADAGEWLVQNISRRRWKINLIVCKLIIYMNIMLFAPVTVCSTKSAFPFVRALQRS